MIPYIIEEIVKDLPMMKIIDYHRSGDDVYAFGDKYILKVSEELSRLQQEFNKDTWVSNHIPSGKPMVFIIEEGKGYYLREYMEGDNLCEKDYFFSNRCGITSFRVRSAYDCGFTIYSAFPSLTITHGGIILRL